MKKGLKVLGLAVGVTALMALTLGGAVFADTSDETDVQTYCAGYGWHGFHGEGAACSETVSELLGITPEELYELRQEGKGFAEIAAEQGVAVDELVAAIMAEKTAAVQARVDNGTLTQERADLMIQHMAERTELAVNRTTTGPAELRMGGQNGMSIRYGSEGMGTGLGGMHQWGRGAR
ncbi:hypothetical protein ACFLYI_00745 [Chloroflexota bacterium]